MFIASFAATAGIVTDWLDAIGLDPWNHGFDLYKFWGVAFVYMYFQIPLMVLIITPAFAGLDPPGARRRRTSVRRAGATGVTWVYPC